MGVSNTGLSGEQEFPSTLWSAIRHAQDPNSPEHKQHLLRLIELYWKPVYFVIRHSWGKNNDDAKDLAQEFFGDLIEGSIANSFPPQRGTFRGLLRTSIAHFMGKVVRDGKRKKRGGDSVFVPFDDTELATGDPVSDVAKLNPEQMFDVAWKNTVMTRAIARLEHELGTAGENNVFEVFKQYHLGAEATSPSYADVGDRLGLSVPQIKHALRHGRGVFRTIVTDLVKEYVDGPRELADELRSFFET